MTPIDILSSGIATAVIPVDPGIALLSVLAALAISFGILSIVTAPPLRRRHPAARPAVATT